MRILIGRLFSIPLALIVAGSSCHRGSSSAPAPASIWYVSSPLIAQTSLPSGSGRDTSLAEGGLIVLDSASLRPRVVAAGGSQLERVAVVTTYQGTRYHPEAIRAVAADSVVLASTGRSISLVSRTGGDRIMVDFQDATPDDLPDLMRMLRAIADASRASSKLPVAVVVPPGDTVSYPTRVLARTADLLAIRLGGEHRNGTAPGPLATPEFMTRAIGMRAEVLGPNRLMAELPLFGYRWDANGAARPITFREAQRLVASEAGSFRRDQASQFLTSTGRDGWTVWVPDARTVAAMIASVRQRGVDQIALAGVEGSDPAIPGIVAAFRR